MDTIFSVAVIAVIIFVLVSKLNKPTSPANNKIDIYELTGPLLTNAEISFYAALRKAVAGQHEVHLKVRIADVMTPRKNPTKGAWQKAFNKISRKHFDFVLCEKNNTTVVCAIELDDRSHNTARAQARDELVEDACWSAGLPLIRFPAKRGYRTSDIRHALAEFLEDERDSTSEEFTHSPLEQTVTAIAIETSKPAQQPEVRQTSITSTDSSFENCPKCTSPLARKKARKGQNAGQIFDVCSGYPTCRFIRQVDGPVA